MKNRTPQYLDKNPGVMGFEQEELMVAGLVFAVLYIANQFLLGVFLGIAAGWIMKRWKRGKPDGYLFHMLYDKLGIHYKYFLPSPSIVKRYED